MFKRLVVLLLFVQNSFTQTYSQERTDKDETIPRYENPRDSENAIFGSWMAFKEFRLENWRGLYIDDPFEKRESEGYTPVIRSAARTKGKALSPYGSKNVQLSVVTNIYKNNYVKYPSDDHPDEYLHIPYKSFGVYLSDWADAPKEIEKDSDNKTFATFEYVIDEKFYGTFVTHIGWLNSYYDKSGDQLDEPKRLPAVLHFNDWLYKFQQKENYEFIERLKIGKKLYLRFGKLFYWNGSLNEEGGEFDTSKTSDEYQIPRYTYEFDLTGSSKALSF